MLQFKPRQTGNIGNDLGNLVVVALIYLGNVCPASPGQEAHKDKTTNMIEDSKTKMK